MRTLYMFLDIAGDYKFKPTGSSYLVFSCLSCEDVTQGVLEAHLAKYDFIQSGIDLHRFHACEDKPEVRERFYRILAGLSHVRIDAVVVEKRKTAPKIRNMGELYPRMVRYLLQYPFDHRGLDVSTFDSILVFLDRETAKPNEKNVAMQAINEWLREQPTNAYFNLCMHPSASHTYLQFADYACWAIFRRWERRDMSAYKTIGHLVESEFPIFQGGSIDWY